MSGDRVSEIIGEWERERPDLDASPIGIIGRLHRLAGHLTGELVGVYRTFGLGEGDFDVLATLRRGGQPYERTPSNLAASTMVTSGAISKRLDRLEAAGLISRRGRDDDGRGRMAALTPAGKDLVDRAVAAHLANEKRLLSSLSADDRTALEAILTRWLADFEGDEA